MCKRIILISTLLITTSLCADDMPRIGPWAIVKQTSKMDDGETTGIVSEASEADGGFSSKPSLFIFCSAKKQIGVSLILHGERVEIEPPQPVEPLERKPHTTVRLRHDKEKAYPRIGLPVADSLLLEVSVKKMFADLERSSILTVELRLASGNSAVAVFPVTQFVGALKALPEGCKAK